MYRETNFSTFLYVKFKPMDVSWKKFSTPHSLLHLAKEITESVLHHKIFLFLSNLHWVAAMRVDAGICNITYLP